MTLEEHILEHLEMVSQKNIAIIGNMPDHFYKILSDKLKGEDNVYIFDTGQNIKRADHILNNIRYNKIHINYFPTFNKKFNWYGWQLLNCCHQLKETNDTFQIFTAIFYRGKHLFQYDMGALPLAINMLANRGIITIYDCAWSLRNSITMKPEVNKETEENYTKEQIKIPHIQYLLDIHVDETLVEMQDVSSAKTRVYKKNRVSLQTSINDNIYY